MPVPLQETMLFSLSAIMKDVEKGKNYKSIYIVMKNVKSASFLSPLLLLENTINRALNDND